MIDTDANQWTTAVKFIVAGIPRPAGSKRYLGRSKAGKPILADDCKRAPAWRADVQNAARMEWADRPLLDEPIRLCLTFLLERPKSHFGTGRNAGVLKDSAPPFPTTKPDLTKIVRAIEDALTKVIWKDDSRVMWQENKKLYGAKPGVVVKVQVLAQETAGPDDREKR